MIAKISIGLPFYNAEKFLADAIRSVFAQTHQDWELILVDDGSSDRSLEIARSVRDPRVRVISDGGNRKLPYRLNQITDEAKFDLIGRMDADDIISPLRFAKQLAILNEKPEIDLVTTGVCSLTNDNNPVGIRCGSPDKAITGRGLLLGQCSILHAAILGRKEWFIRNQYDEALARAQDHELWVRAFFKDDFKCIVMSDPLYYFREEGSVAPERLLRSYKAHRYIYSKYGYLGFKRYELLLMLTNTYMKSAMVLGLSKFNLLNRLVDRRNADIPDDETLNSFTTEIEQVLATKVPGLD